jgi:hypothetical protein
MHVEMKQWGAKDTLRRMLVRKTNAFNVRSNFEEHDSVPHWKGQGIPAERYPSTPFENNPPIFPSITS